MLRNTIVGLKKDGREAVVNGIECLIKLNTYLINKLAVLEK